MHCSVYTLWFWLISGILLSAGIRLSAQAPDTSKNRIYIIHAEFLDFEKKGELEYQYLRQDVVIRHKNTYLFCDSAVITGLTVRALGHVRIVEGDSLQIFGDTLNYDGAKLKAELIQNVTLNHHGRQLFTDKLFYDLKKRIASYQTGGLLIQDSTRMQSKKAWYNARTEQAFFKDSVNIILDDGMNVQADTIQFDSKQNKVVFLAPTRILQNELSVYCEQGYYDITQSLAYFDKNPVYTERDESAEARTIIHDQKNKITTLLKDAVIRDSSTEAHGDTIIINDTDHSIRILGHADYRDEERKISGDRILYNRLDRSLQVSGRTHLKEGKQDIEAQRIDYKGDQDLGFAYGDVVVRDTQSGWEIHCDTFSYNKKTKRFEPVGMRKYIATPMDNDTLYLTAEEIVSEQVVDGTDSFQIMIARRDVRIWSKQLQGLCDSLFYSGRDSSFTMHVNPVLWSDTTQFTGDTIRMFMKNKTMDQVHLLQHAFILTESQTRLDNQVKGRTIFAYFNQRKINYTDVTGNAETIYFVQDDDKDYIGMNYIQCSSMRINFLQNQKIDNIHFYTKPTGNLMPTNSGKDKRLEGFAPRSSEKPLTFEDLFQ